MQKLLLAITVVANSLYLTSQVQSACAADAQTMLNGEVARNEIQQENDVARPAGITVNGSNRLSTIIINSSQRSDGLSRLDGMFDRLHMTRLTTEQYRDMKYGVIGIMVQQSLTGSLPMIIDLLPECPAMLAGMQKGDELVEANGHQFEPGQGQLEFMRVIGGEAGTNVDVTISRQDKKVQYHLVRMNVEDIADDRVRLRYENILTLLRRSKSGITTAP
jgi:C-terminal processing protease CtpA/Prc